MLGKALTAGSTLIVHALLTRLVTPAEYGAYNLAMSVVIVGAMAAQLGLHQAVVRVVAEALGTGHPGRARAVVGMVYRYALLGAGGVAVLLLGGGGSWLTLVVWDSPLLASVVGGLTVWVVAMAYQYLTSECFRGFQDLRLATTFGGVITGGLIVLSLATVLVVRGASRLEEVVWISVAATGVSVLLGLVALRAKLRPLGSPEPYPRRKLFGIALPMWVNSVTTFALMRSDLWILGAFMPKDEVGFYAAAAGLVATVSMSLILVNLVVPPFIAEMYARGETARLQRVLRTTATLAGVPAFLALMAFVLFGGPILGLVYGADYRVGATVLALLSVGKLVNVATGSCGVTMGMTGHQTKLMTITIATSVLTVGAALLVVRPFGTLGVASTVAAGTVIQNLSMWLATRYYTGLWTHAALPRLRDVKALIGS